MMKTLKNCMLALCLCTAPLAHAATSVYPDGADGGDGFLDGTGGFFPETRQLDFDFLLSLADEYLPAILPTWNSGDTPLWQSVAFQEGPEFYGRDNDGNDITDHDHLDALAAIVNGGAAAATGVNGADIAAIQAAFANNRIAVQNREIVFPRLTATFIISVSLNNVATGKTQTLLGNDIAVPSLWTAKEIATTGDPEAKGLLAEANPMLELLLRDWLAAEMTLASGAASNEVAHVQSFMNVFLTNFLQTQLPTLLSGLGEVTLRPGNNFATLDIDMDVVADGIGTIRVRIAGATQGSQHTQQAIAFFVNSFTPTPPTTTWSGAGYGSGTPAAPNAWHDGVAGGTDWPLPNFVTLSGAGSLAASGDLNGDLTSNLDSYAAALENRQTFMSNEGITVAPLQFLPVDVFANGLDGEVLTIGDDEFVIIAGDGSALAYDWETVATDDAPLFLTNYEHTDPVLGGVTDADVYEFNPVTLADNGKKLSVQVADDTWTRTLPAFALSVNDAPLEGEGEGIVEGVVEGIVEGVIEGEGEGVVEGIVEGVIEGEGEGVVEGIVEGVIEGGTEGVVEGIVEGDIEGIVEGVVEGDIEGVVEGVAEGVFEGVEEGSVEFCTYTVNVVGCINCSIQVDGSFSISSGFTFQDECGSEHCFTAPLADPENYVFVSWGNGVTDTTYCTSETTLTAYYDPIITEGQPEGNPEGVIEGTPEGVFEGVTEGTVEGVVEGTVEGSVEGVVEGSTEGTVEGSVEGVTEGDLEGTVEGVVEGITEGEGEVDEPQVADLDGDFAINLVELLRLIQLYNGIEFHCDITGEDGFAVGTGDITCTVHSSDYAPQDWKISLSELLRLVQVFNIGEYYECDSEDGFCPGEKN